MLRLMTAGESHGPALNVILEGLPAGMELDFEAINRELARRQRGYGRGARMKIEQDRVEILGGLRSSQTTGGPISFLIQNKDWKNWKDKLSPYERPPAGTSAELLNPRPGHADLAGALKYGVDDLRNILERASARETAARVAAGAVAKQFLKHFECEIRSHVVGVGCVQLPNEAPEVAWEEIISISEDAPLNCADAELEKKMVKEVDRATQQRDTLGGVIEIVAHTPPPGLGSYIQWDRKLDGRLAQAILSIPAMKAMGFGRGVDSASTLGSALHDEIFYSSSKGLHRGSNNAGGLEGGVTNGQELRIRAYMKPLSSLRKPLRSIDIRTMKPIEAARVRSDICAVPAAGVVSEAMVAFTLADAAVEKFGGDSLTETLRNHTAHMRHIDQVLRARDQGEKS